MASFVNTSLDIIRRHKHNRRPRLHARWGDVSITAPVEGAWSQYHNPHSKGKKLYGPGFVPGVTDSNKEVLLLDAGYLSDGERSEDISKEDSDEEEAEEVKKKDFKARRRLTRILLPSNINTPTKRVDEKPVEFEYKPIRPDYAQEVAEKREQESRPNFRYVPASEAYFRELHDSVKSKPPEEDEKGIKKHMPKRKPVPQTQRSHSCEPRIGIGGTEFVLVTSRQRASPTSSTGAFVVNAKDAIPGTLPSNTLVRKTTSPRKNSIPKEPFEQHRGRVKQTQKDLEVQRSQSTTVRRSRRRTMTLDMVGDQDDLW